MNEKTAVLGKQNSGGWAHEIAAHACEDCNISRQGYQLEMLIMSIWNPETWSAYSKKRAWQLAQILSESLFDAGIKNTIGGDHINGPHIQGHCFNIRFEATPYGCKLEGNIFEEDKDTDLLRNIWQVWMIEKLLYGESPEIKNEPSLEVVERRKKVAALRKILTIGQLASRFGVSKATINRDIKFLGVKEKKVNAKDSDT
jgi:hypothetical protein